MSSEVHRRKFFKDGVMATMGLALLPFPRVFGAPTFDFLIRGGTLVDGTGAPAWRGDIGLVGDEIRAVGLIDPGQGQGL